FGLGHQDSIQCWACLQRGPPSCIFEWLQRFRTYGAKRICLARGHAFHRLHIQVLDLFGPQLSHARHFAFIHPQASAGWASSYRDEDREAFFHVRAMTYNDGRPIPPEDQVFKTTRGYVGEVDGKIAGVFSVLDFTCTRGETTYRDAAVAGVAVLPEHRRSGVG